MRISKFFLIIVIATAVALGYVHQQIELFRVSYRIEVNEENMVRLLDGNSFLLYNLIALKSPHNLEQILLAKNVNFELPAPYQLVRINQPQFDRELSRWEKTRITLASIFALSPSAEAKMIKK